MIKIEEIGIFIYIDQIIPLRKLNINFINSLYLFKYIKNWKNYLNYNFYKLYDEILWINFRAIEFLNKSLKNFFQIYHKFINLIPKNFIKKEFTEAVPLLRNFSKYYMGISLKYEFSTNNTFCI